MPDKPVTFKPNVRSGNFVSAYANNVQFGFSPWDIVLTFSEFTRTETDEGIEIQPEEHASVRLSWTQAKVAAILFAANVALQEQRSGPIWIPPDVIPAWVDNADVHLSLIEIAKRIIKKAEESPKPAAES